ncbi:MAG: hypothetical protein R3D25_15790 [Geminicoccaceae bacterium]
MAATFLVGTGGFGTLLFGTAFTGSLLAVAARRAGPPVARRLPPVRHGRDRRALALRPGIYGVAIAAGALAHRPHTSLIIG